MTLIRGILFDKDGTLFDFAATWGRWTRSLIGDLSGGAGDRAVVLARAIGYDLETGAFHPASPVIAHTPSEIAETLLEHLPGASPMSLVARMNALSADAPLVEATPLRPLLEALRAQGFALGVVTNDAEEPAHSHLRKAQVDHLFSFVAGSDSGYGAKPAPGPLLAFTTAVGLRPAEVVMVGDSRHDLVAGRSAGMRTVGVLTGLAAEGDLAPLADVVLPDIGHLPLWLAAQNAALAVTA
jgi:phosphoglycolate phosphatase